MSMTLRAVALALVCSAVAANGAFAQTADYPSRPIRLLLPVPAGGFADLLGRLIAQRMSVVLAQPVIVENHPGAGGVIPTGMAVNAPADGYTMLLADTGQIAITPALMKLPYDTVRDLAPVTYMGEIPLFLVTHQSVAATSFGELVALIKAKPGQLTLSTIGTGSIHHLSAEALKPALGLDFLIVQYKGVAPAVQALVAGQVSMSLSALPALQPHLNSGTVRVLAVNTPKRASLVPSTPTIAESGAPGFDYPAGLGMLVRAGTPAPLVAKLAAEVAGALRHADNPQRLAKFGFEIVGSTPEEYAARIKADIAKYAKVVKDAGIKAN